MENEYIAFVSSRKNKKKDEWILTTIINKNTTIINTVNGNEMITDSFERIRKIYRAVKNLDDNVFH